MSSSPRVVRFGMAVLAAVAVTACAAAIRVNSYSERAANFSEYRTFGFVPAESVSTGDPRLDNNPFFLERVQTAVERELAARGYEKTNSGRPDLVIHFHASTTQEIDLGDIDRKYTYPSESNRRPYVYEAGTLLLDFVDGRTNKLAWRGWAEGTMDGIDSQAWMEQTVDESVKRILARLPRRS